jgi:lantibiotic biosynthesis protein
MGRHPDFRAVDGIVIRASTYPAGLVLPPWPDLDCAGISGITGWISEVWPLPGVAAAITAASPDLASALTGICADPAGPRTARQVRRAAESLMRYLLRWAGRATPFGLFAGVAPVTAGSDACVRFGDRHTTVIRPGGTWVTDTVTTLEKSPELLRQLPVMASNLGFARGQDWVLPCQPGSGDGPVPEALVRHTAAVRMVLQEARTPALFCDLLARLAAESPQTPPDVIEGMLTELVRLKILLTSLWPPLTVTSPAAYLSGQLARVTPAAVGRPDPGGREAAGVRLDCDVTLPRTVIREAEKAAAVLVRLARPRLGWAAYHATFTDRYGPGAMVAVTELVDPDRGLGYPAGFRGSLYRSDPLVTARDTALAALAQKSALDGCTEVVLDDGLLATLETSRPAGTVPHTELRATVNAPALEALGSGDFTLTVVSASRHAGTSVGRFLHLLAEPDRDRITRAWQALPASTAGAMAAQISSPPLTARTDPLARAPRVLPLLSLGEHRPSGDPGIDITDLAVTADAHRLILVSRSRGRAVEPVIFSAVDLRRHAHPLARFLCEVSTATAAPCTPLSWGPLAEGLPFLPRVRAGRVILSPARWNLTSDDLPSPAAGDWARHFDQFRRSRRIPDSVRLGDDDVLLRVNLTEPSHLALVRRHLDRAGTAVLTEDTGDCGWIGGRAHEIVVPLASADPPRPLARTIRPGRTWHGPGHLPGASTWLQASIFGHPGRHVGLLTGWLPGLLGQWTHGPADGWWFIRSATPAPHLRIRLPLHHPGAYGPAARTLGEWTRSLHDAGLLADVTLGTYRPETGRYGTGPAMAAAEAVFAADSAFTVAHLSTAASTEAATAAAMIDLAAAFHGQAAPAWLTEHLGYGGGPALERSLLAQVLQSVPVSPELAERRRSAIAAYRALLAADDADAVLADLLHLHHNRMIGTDAGSERRCLRLARAAAQNLIARGRSRPSTRATGPVPAPTP